MKQEEIILQETDTTQLVIRTKESISINNSEKHYEIESIEHKVKDVPVMLPYMASISV